MKIKNRRKLNEIKHLNYDIFNPKWKQLNLFERERDSNFAIIIYFLKGFYRLVAKTLLSFSLRESKKRKKNVPVIFLVGSHNNLSSIKPVYDKLNKKIDAEIYAYNNYSHSVCKKINEFPIYLKAWTFIPSILLSALRAVDGYEKKALLARLDRCCISLVYKEFWIDFFNRGNQKTLVVSNDHSVWTRAAILAAKKCNIHTVFIPHAPTGKHPAPPIYDIALLDGLVQYNNYYPRPVCLLTGAVRYESIVANSDEKSANKGILLCFNKVDTIPFIKEILSEVRELQDFGFTVYVKPHPADFSRFRDIKRICEDHNFIFNSDIKDISYYGKKVGIVIAGNSGVHLDATLLGKKAMTLTKWYGTNDYYGFIENEVITSFLNLEDMKLAIKNTSIASLSNESAADFNIHMLNKSSEPSSICSKFLFDFTRSDLDIVSFMDCWSFAVKVERKENLYVHYSYQGDQHAAKRSC